MKRIMMMLAYVNIMHAMQHDRGYQAGIDLTKINILRDASYFILHAHKECQVYRVPCEFHYDFKCKEHHDSSMQAELDKRDTAVAIAVFYDRNDNQVGNKETHCDYIGSLVTKQLAEKLDPNAKPIAVRAEIDYECWYGKYIRFFDEQGHSLFKMPYDGYFFNNSLSADDKIEAEKYMKLAATLTIKDNLQKSKGWCGCCIVV